MAHNTEPQRAMRRTHGALWAALGTLWIGFCGFLGAWGATSNDPPRGSAEPFGRLQVLSRIALFPTLTLSFTPSLSLSLPLVFSFRFVDPRCVWAPSVPPKNKFALWLFLGLQIALLGTMLVTFYCHKQVRSAFQAPTSGLFWEQIWGQFWLNVRVCGETSHIL